jgi:alcohol dehydrogenase (cytochrome c)/quinohemoprotein ethanol dehydrogenase
MVLFKSALWAEDAEAIRQYLIARANQDKALEAQTGKRIGRRTGKGIGRGTARN